MKKSTGANPVVEPPEGIEPPTQRLQNARSAS